MDNTIRGFTLLELLIVISIFTILLGMGLVFTMDTLHGSFKRSGRDTLISVLTTARSRALAHVHASAHGVCSIPPDLVLFRGNSYDATDITNETIQGVSSAQIISEDDFFNCDTGAIIFSGLEATTTPHTLTITEPGASDIHLEVNSEGMIAW